MEACCNKASVEKNFSRYADLYDTYADIQSRTADELLKKIPDLKPDNILDIGCGTGGYTLGLKDKFKGSCIEAVDISPDMIRVARLKCGNSGIKFIIADAEAPDNLGASYDLVTSNATFQWFGDLETSLVRYKAAINPNGAIAFSTFGPRTFCELGRALKEVLGPNARIASNRFLEKDSLSAMMKRHFRNSEVEEVIIKKNYGSLEELLRHIKYTGTRGRGIAGMSGWTRTTLDKIAEAYLSDLGAIEASYQVFYCRGLR